MFDTGLFRGIKTAGDFAREEQEFEMRKRQRAMQEQIGNMKYEQAKLDFERAKKTVPDRFGGTGQFSIISNTAYRDALAQGLSPAEAEKAAIDKALQATPQYQMVADPSNPYGPPVPMQMPRQAIFGAPQPMQRPAQPVMSDPYAAPQDYSRTPDFMPPEVQVNDLPQPFAGGDMMPIPSEYAESPSVADVFAQPQAPAMPSNSGMVNPFEQRQAYTPIPQSMPNIDPRAMSAPPVQMDAAKQALANQLKTGDPSFILDQRKFGLEQEKFQAKQSEVGRKKSEQKQQQSKYASIVKDDLLRILDIRKQTGFPDTGTPAKLASWIGESQAGRIASLLEGIRPNIAFNRLTEMRQSSPTGGAVGNLTDDERKALSDTLGSLNQYSDPALFDENVKRIYNQFMDTIHGTPEHISSYGQQVGIPQKEIEQLSFRYPLAMQQLDPRNYTGEQPVSEIDSLLNKYAPVR